VSRAHTTAAALLIAVAPAAAHAQLRPLEPLDWSVFVEERSFSAWTGVGLHTEQRASLAGTIGRLREVGNYQLTWRTGRVALEASGTAYRRFRDDGPYGAPYPGTPPSAGPGTIRSDAGDVRLLTAVRLTPEPSPLTVALRFGTRLPTTNNRKGLDRDQADFLATVAARSVQGRLTASGELGIGLLGTRDPSYEQSDLLQFAAQLAWDGGLVTPSLAWVGQQRTAPFEYQGTESLGELRLGAQVGRRRWIRATLVRGTADVSPKWGGLLAVGMGA
jgi:hypothetical protein